MALERQFQALCFGEPVGPWRRSRSRARDDLIGRKLGEYDERGRFYVTVPGDMQFRDFRI